MTLWLWRLYGLCGHKAAQDVGGKGGVGGAVAPSLWSGGLVSPTLCDHREGWDGGAEGLSWGKTLWCGGLGAQTSRWFGGLAPCSVSIEKGQMGSLGVKLYGLEDSRAL